MRNLIILALLASSTVANAQTATTTINRYQGQTTITTRMTPAFSARPAFEQMPVATDSAVSRAREAAWQERCKPTVGPADANGMRRYVYAAPNCDIGE